jgi:hypothetical protein
MRAARRTRARGQAFASVATVVAVALALILLERAGPRSPSAAVHGRAVSGAWICPHGGGGDRVVSLYLANPGPSTVSARITGLAGRSPEPSTAFEVPGGATVRVPVTADVQGAGTYVEYFGGWIAAGWVESAGAEGLAAEPCAAEAATRWWLPDGTTELGEDAYLVITNPFEAQAVLDVVIYSPERAPVRDSEWTNLVVRPRRSISLRINDKVQGEAVTAAEIDVRVGRVAVASNGVTKDGGLRSALGWTQTSTSGVFPVIGGAGSMQLLVLSPGERSIRFGATELSSEPPRPAGGLTEQDHGPFAATAYPIEIGSGPTGIELFTLDGARVAGAVRAIGAGDDRGATGGAVEPAPDWVVLPSVAGASGEPALALVNDGDRDAVVHLEILAREGGAAAAPVTVEVPAHGAAAAPPAFLASAPGSAVLVRSDVPIVALGAASVETRRGAGFALSMGAALPRTP